KGDSGSYGFEDLADKGTLLEQAAINKDPEKIRKLADEISTYLKNVRIVVKGSDLQVVI
ncbi:MAG: hypothetical protein HZA09_00685, partial [Nitrospirae bacterium]|nr:hypothetical protein [Nitrospirota bacterium]